MANSLGTGKWHHTSQGSKRYLKTGKSIKALEFRTNYNWCERHIHALIALKKTHTMKSTLTNKTCIEPEPPKKKKKTINEQKENQFPSWFSLPFWSLSQKESWILQDSWSVGTEIAEISKLMEITKEPLYWIRCLF